MRRSSRALLFAIITTCCTTTFDRLSCLVPEKSSHVFAVDEMAAADIFAAAQQGNLKLIKLALRNGFDLYWVDAGTQCTVLGAACKSLNIAIMIASHYNAYLNQRWYITGDSIISQLNQYFKDIALHKQVVDFLVDRIKPPVNKDDQEIIEMTCKLLKGLQEDADLSHKLLHLLLKPEPRAG